MQNGWKLTTEPTDKDWLRFRVAPRDAGQMVEHSYALDLQAAMLWRRTIDRSTPHDGAEYAKRPLTDREIDRETTAECAA